MALLLNRRKNPFFEHAEAEYFLAERGDEVVGRIAAISNRLHNETHSTLPVTAAAMQVDPLTRHISYSQVDLRREYPVR